MLKLQRTPAALTALRLSAVASLVGVLSPAPAHASDWLDKIDLTSADTQVILGIGIAIGVLVMILFSFRSQVRQLVRRELDQERFRESRLLEVTTAISQELHLGPLLQLIMKSVTEILDSDRSTLFLYDNKTKELWSTVAQGLQSKEIRFPARMGLAGSSFTSGEIINIPDAYADDRFNPSFDKKTGYRTNSILCFPVRTKQSVVIGVIQVLNKNGGPFTEVDTTRLGAFCAQASVAIENAQLFEDVVTMKNYSEAILESMTEGVLTFDAERNVTRANLAAYRIFGHGTAHVFGTGSHQSDDPIVGKTTDQLFVQRNQWVADAVTQVLQTGISDETLDTELWIIGKNDTSNSLTPGDDEDAETRSVNLAVRPLTDARNERIGGLVVIEDISTEKRVRATMARYVPKEVADKLMQEGGDALGGTLQKSTVLFSDIRAFTAFSERVGPQETVGMLNEYFTIMADIVMNERGILDKYIGDAIMAVFGAPLATDNDADHAVSAAIDMLAALRFFNERRIADGKEPIDIGIGVNTDEVLSGNIGSAKRMDYTVIGDGVNLAARLESANKTYGTRLLVSEFTVKALQTEVPLRLVDRITVKGKSGSVGVYEPRGAWDELTYRDVPALFERFDAAIACYLARDWDAAIAGFDSALELHEDSVSRLYKGRCEHWKEHPPPDDWDGVWVMQSK